jgi:hypothetical protein
MLAGGDVSTALPVIAGVQGRGKGGYWPGGVTVVGGGSGLMRPGRPPVVGRLPGAPGVYRFRDGAGRVPVSWSGCGTAQPASWRTSSPPGSRPRSRRWAGLAPRSGSPAWTLRTSRLRVGLQACWPDSRSARAGSAPGRSDHAAWPAPSPRWPPPRRPGQTLPSATPNWPPAWLSLHSMSRTTCHTPRPSLGHAEHPPIQVRYPPASNRS